MNAQPVNAIYALIGDHASLSWLYYAESKRTAQGSQTLAQTIQSHITLTLRDLTPGSVRLFNQLQQSDSRARNAALTVKGDDSSQMNPRLLFARATLIFLLSLSVVVAGILTAFSV
jgi:hypothetical protein